MPDLIAQGPRSHQRIRRPLTEGRRVVLGRSAGIWTVPWDERISRRHARLFWSKGRLSVRRLETGRNPIVCDGKSHDEFEISIGQSFVIGETTFTLSGSQTATIVDSPPPNVQKSYSSEFLHRLQYRDATERIDQLSRLPDLIHSAKDDAELFSRLTAMLLAGISISAAVAMVKYVDEEDPRLLHWDGRDESTGRFRPSQRLIKQAVDEGRSVVHVWTGTSAASAESTDPKYTAVADVAWAFCVPLAGEACRGWAVYVAGSESHRPAKAISEPDELQDELKFSEVVSSTVSSVRALRLLQRQRAALEPFFPERVMSAIESGDAEQVLAPRETDVTVVFCDLRGFSRQAEEAAADLMGLLHRVSGALGVATRHIHDQSGVVGDFHGDATMGFWGWPLDDPQAALHAALAALAIRTEFSALARRSDHALSGFRIGIGMASGPAVAGRIGTAEQVKITAFGPVVNLAARLEGMTRAVGADILIDGETAMRLGQIAAAGLFPARRLGRFRPYGLQQPTDVWELLPEPHDERYGRAHLGTFEQALAAFESGNWQAAESALASLENDPAATFLWSYIGQHSARPVDWRGVIEMEGKHLHAPLQTPNAEGHFRGSSF